MSQPSFFPYLSEDSEWSEGTMFDDSPAYDRSSLSSFTDANSTPLSGFHDATAHSFPSGYTSELSVQPFPTFDAYCSEHDADVDAWVRAGAASAHQTPDQPLGLSFRDFELYPEPSTSALPSQQALLFQTPLFDANPLPTEPQAALPTSNLLYTHKSTSTTSLLDLQSSPPTHQPTLRRAADKLPLPRRPSASRHRSKPATKRHPCPLPACAATFARHSDLSRHQQDVHRLGSQTFGCAAAACDYRSRRCDKMREHCRNIHAHPRGKEGFETLLMAPAAPAAAAEPVSSAQGGEEGCGRGRRRKRSRREAVAVAEPR